MKFTTLKKLGLVALIAGSVSCDFALYANDTACYPMTAITHEDGIAPALSLSTGDTHEFARPKARRHRRIPHHRNK